MRKSVLELIPSGLKDTKCKGLALEGMGKPRDAIENSFSMVTRCVGMWIKMQLKSSII